MQVRIEPQQQGQMHSTLIAQLELIAKTAANLDAAEEALRAYVSPTWWLVGRGGHHVWLSIKTQYEPVRVAMITEDSDESFSGRPVSITSVTTVSGSAGGLKTPKADVTLRVQGAASNVEDVRAYVEQAVKHHDALVTALQGLYAQLEKGFLLNAPSLCAEYRRENSDACEKAVDVLVALGMKS